MCYKRFEFERSQINAARTCKELGYDSLYDYSDAGVLLPDNGSWMSKEAPYYDQNSLDSKSLKCPNFKYLRTKGSCDVVATKNKDSIFVSLFLRSFACIYSH